MLKRFFQNVLSSFVGTWLAIGLLVFGAIVTLIAIGGSLAAISSKGETEKVTSRSILRISLDGPIAERESATAPDMVSLIRGDVSMPQTLDVLVKSIEEAADNKNIAAIYLDCGSVSAGTATLDALRHALLDFKEKTGGRKKIIAYAEQFSQGAYFVASVADEIYMNPAGEFSMQGLSGGTPYVKGLLDKLGVKMQVVKVGVYKSAVEPFLLEHMSEPARAQMDTLLNDFWGYIRKGIAEQRKGVTEQGIDSLIDVTHISFKDAKVAVKAGLVDSLMYDRQLKERFADLTGKEVKKLNFVGPSTLVSQTPWSTAYNSKKQIAVLFAEGDIQDGDKNQINYEDLVPVIIDLAEDDNVKGMVLRVNSPGGSVYGSTLIGEALDYFQSKGKPLAVSMGDYAASGGYWISSHADRIFADPLTLTGSIGIFGMIPNVEGTLNKLGINIETVATNPGANFPSVTKLMTPEQYAVMQQYIDEGYDKFVTRVATGRKMTKEAVCRIAEGRVWAAPTAVKIGLVDQLGYLQEAIEWTAKQAKVEKSYDVAAYPLVEENFWNMVLSSGITGAQLKAAIETKDETVLKSYLLHRILSRQPMQARMPEFRIYL